MVFRPVRIRLKKIVRRVHWGHFMSGADKGAELWRLHLTVQDAEVMLRDCMDKLVVTSHHFGKGIAHHYATALSLG